MWPFLGVHNFFEIAFSRWHCDHLKRTFFADTSGEIGCLSGPKFRGFMLLENTSTSYPEFPGKFPGIPHVPVRSHQKAAAPTVSAHLAESSSDSPHLAASPVLCVLPSFAPASLPSASLLTSLFAASS